ncbi:flagellin [Halosimplex aquaticum]|uniref:Flagellin n=1 Tax=Halosimplex aquaticum TaxID=3026162 RepID=A0ABD5Y9T6_9EURY|nr:flagellin [Halosimplex aquaticum]
MGFSVSGSLVVVLLGLFIALGAYYGSVSNAMERVTEAREDRTDRVDRVHGTAIEITSISLLTDATCGVQVRINNTGDTKLLVPDTDLLLDNDYRAQWDDTVVDGTVNGTEPNTKLWFPGERLTIEESGLDTAPRSVKVVSGPGVADSQEVSTLSCS